MSRRTMDFESIAYASSATPARTATIVGASPAIIAADGRRRTHGADPRPLLVRGQGRRHRRRAAGGEPPRRAPSRRRAAGPRSSRPTSTRRSARAMALHCLLGVAGSLVAVAVPALGFGLVLLAATSLYLDLNYRFYLLRRLFFRRASQNVVSPAPGPGAPARLVLVAHYDAGRTGAVFVSKRARRASRFADRHAWAGPYRLVFWSLALLLPTLGARMAGARLERARDRPAPLHPGPAGRDLPLRRRRSSPTRCPAAGDNAVRRRHRGLAGRGAGHDGLREPRRLGGPRRRRANACRRGCDRSSGRIGRNWATYPPTSLPWGRWAAATSASESRADGRSPTGWTGAWSSSPRRSPTPTPRPSDASGATAGPSRRGRGDAASAGRVPGDRREHDRRRRSRSQPPPAGRHPRQPRPRVTRARARLRPRADRAGSTRTSGGEARRRDRIASGDLLWEPSAERIERATMTRYMRWLESERELSFGAYDELWRWSVDSLEDFWRSIWDFFDVRSSAPPTSVLSEPWDARARAGSTAPRSTTPSTSSADKAGDEVALQHASETRELAELQLGRPRALRSPRPRPACGRWASGAGDRVAAYLPERPRGDRRLPRHRVDRRGLVELLARLRRQRGDRPVRPDRAEGAARRRRLQLRRQGVRPLGDRRGPDRGDAAAARTVVVELMPGSAEGGLGGETSTWSELLAAGDGRRADLRAGALRPPALGPLLVRDDRPAEGDRPGPGRDPARAPEEAQPPRRRPGRRPHLLVHDDRLDDVELPRLGAAHAGLDRPLRRQPRPSRHGRPLGPRRARRRHLLRHLGELRRRLHEGRGRALLPAATSRASAAVGSTGLAARPRGLRVDLRPRRRGHLAVLHLRRHRRLHRVRRRGAAAAGLPRRAPGARPRRQGRGLGPRRQARWSARSASWC